MSEGGNITDKILKLLNQKPYERSLTEIKNQLKLSDYKLRGRIEGLVDQGQLVITRTVGKTKFYCLPEHKDKII